MKTVQRERKLKTSLILPESVMLKVDADSASVNLPRSTYIQMVLEGRLKVPKKRFTGNAQL